MFFRRSKDKGGSDAPKRIALQLDRADGVYAPGETMIVTARWRSGVTVDYMECAVEWSTEGKGDSNGDAVAEEIWDDLQSVHSVEWKVVLPRGPLSVQGQLLSIVWAVHCDAQIEGDRSEETQEIQFTLTHGREPLVLNKVAENGANAKTGG
ncbi:MAG: hypothetical protein ACK5OB_12730 [Pirellula sp.]